MNQGKWGFLRDFYYKTQETQQTPLTITQVADLAVQQFELPLSTEQVRKIISREINRENEETTNFVQVQDYTNTPIVTITANTSLPNNLNPWHIQSPQPKNEFTTPGTYLVLGCIHVPGHNKAMINGITDLMIDKRNSIEGLMLIGDFLDLNSLSGHDIGKFTALPGLTLDDEYEYGREVLKQLTGPLKTGAEKVFMYGNHEDRFNRFMSNMQAAKAPISSPRKALKLAENGFHVFENWKSDYVKLGSHLELIHGQYFNTHCAKQHIDRFRGSVMFAHTHRVQTYIEGATGGFNIGWGGDIDSPLFNYAERGTKSQWCNGFALVTIDEKGDYFVQQVICYKNKFYVDGKSYS